MQSAAFENLRTYSISAVIFPVHRWEALRAPLPAPRAGHSPDAGRRSAKSQMVTQLPAPHQHYKNHNVGTKGLPDSPKRSTELSSTFGLSVTINSPADEELGQ